MKSFGIIRAFHSIAFFGAFVVSSSDADVIAPIVKIQVNPDVVISRISPDFIGFGYETSAVALTNYFSASNLALIRLYDNLCPHGLIRIGGIISDHTRYIPDGVPAVKTQDGVTIINQANLKSLGEFARATGWKVMWGLNLGTGSKEEAVQQALAVNTALGSSIQSFQIGNEVENLRRFGGDFAKYHAAYLDYKSAVRNALPNAPFSGPDVADSWKWLTNFVDSESADVQLITHHYYRGGAKDPASTLEKLLGLDTKFNDRLTNLRQISHDHRRGYRINEVNSFYGGGKQGVSDTFGSALWCLDYMFRLASMGCEGVNMETDINQLGFVSHYSPIVRDEVDHCVVRPEYYGMLAFSLAAKGELVATTLDNTNLAVSAYAAKDDNDVLWVTAVNKDFSNSVFLRIALPKGYGPAEVYRLAAPSMESKDHVTLAGTEVQSDGNWTQGRLENITAHKGIAELNLPSSSAAVIRIQAPDKKYRSRQ